MFFSRKTLPQEETLRRYKVSSAKRERSQENADKVQSSK
jgi:hypothetical protein